MKYNTVIFDFDGTLVDSQQGITKGFQKGLAAFGVQESLEVIKGLIGPPLSKTIQTKYGFSPEDGRAAMKICVDYQLGEGLSEISIYPGVIDMLKTLKNSGIRLGIATNKPCTTAEAQIGFFSLEKYFDSIQSNDATQTRGTKADFVRMAMQDCAADPATTLMVGDRAEDIKGGKENGIDTAAVLYGYGSLEELKGINPTHIVKTPSELLDLLLG